MMMVMMVMMAVYMFMPVIMVMMVVRMMDALARPHATRFFLEQQ